MKPITPTEKKVLELIAGGFSSVEAARALQISPHTVNTHRKNLLRKFDAKNAAELVFKATRRLGSGVVGNAIPQTQPDMEMTTRRKRFPAT